MPTLDQLVRGNVAIISAVNGDDVVVQRLMEMGLLEGEEIEVLGFAPLGDPMEVRLRDYRLSLRRSEAARIAVQPRGAS
jgi:ferrous iron transport protein A